MTIDRRSLLEVGLLSAAASSFCLATAEIAATQPLSKTYVLVHGAWHGGWCWKEVAGELRRMGHRVSTPTQTGLGECKHLLSKDITLDTFAADIINHIEAEELNDIILVGHSFGGTSITGAADKIPNRIRHLVYLDSVIWRMAKAYSVYCLPMLWQLGAKPSPNRGKASSFLRRLRQRSAFPKTTPRQTG